MSEPILSEFLTMEELAKQLSVNPRTILRWHLLNTGPPRTKIGKRVFYRRASVDRWLAAREEKARAA